MENRTANESSQKTIDKRIQYGTLVNTVGKDVLISPNSPLASAYKAKVVDAYRNRRIFTVFGKYNTVRRLLLSRGWLEKLPPDRFTNLQKLSEEVVLAKAKKGNDFEAVLISKLINHFPAFFVWQFKGQKDLYTDVLPYRNRLRIPIHVDFSTKVGLITCAEQQQWYSQEGTVGVLHPRFFRIDENMEERLGFIDEYRITQCCSLLRYLVNNFFTHKSLIDDEKGTVDKTVVHFALARVKRKLDDYSCGLLDVDSHQVTESDWESFLENSSKVINEREKIKCVYQDLVALAKASNSLLTKMEENHPDLKWDGYQNLWILKPGYLSRGRGIVIFNNLKQILQWGNTHSHRHYIVQKYIERPLLIYDTKFDIRQYMLICVRTTTVQIWMYTDCYLRFSSQEYRTDDFDESIHLTNNCVQKKYKNQIKRDARLPQSNMWSLDQFKFYLNLKNMPESFWESHIFAGFRAQLIAVVLPSLDETELCENSFELFGCDFMLDEEFNPILIEINATPDLTPTTEVTARICPLVLEDCLKVVIDVPRKNKSPTGLFTMIYEVNYRLKQDFSEKEGLNVFGKAVELCKPTPRISHQLKLKNIHKLNTNRQTKCNSGKKNMTSQLTDRVSKSCDAMKVLKASAKEVLALRYTVAK